MVCMVLRSIKLTWLLAPAKAPARVSVQVVREVNGSHGQWLEQTTRLEQTTASKRLSTPTVQRLPATRQASEQAGKTAGSWPSEPVALAARPLCSCSEAALDTCARLASSQDCTSRAIRQCREQSWRGPAYSTERQGSVSTVVPKQEKLARAALDSAVPQEMSRFAHATGSC